VLPLTANSGKTKENIHILVEIKGMHMPHFHIF
jgi:hypothetical protein